VAVAVDGDQHAGQGDHRNAGQGQRIGQVAEDQPAE
jgi:hypothetical protein